MHTAAEQDALHAVQPERQRTSHQGKKLRYEGSRMPCPMCRATSEVRNSYFPNENMREVWYQCTNVECGCTFVFTGEISRILNPGATPNPKVNIPLSAHVRRDIVRVMLNNAGEAAHQTRFTPPVTGDMFAGDENTS